MKRSVINAVLRDAEAIFLAARFQLPKFADWTPEAWENREDDISEIVECGLGWDVTDFGSGDIGRCGILLFTLRNGRPGNLGTGRGKTYCEKVAILEQGQYCPTHHHWSKVEDIVVRDGSILIVQVHNAADDGSLAGTDVTVSMDGIRRTVAAGTRLRLHPGDSITLEPGCYHRLEAPYGRVIFGEISTVNDDTEDNRFLEPIGRWPAVEEDEPPYHLLVSDYAARVRA